MYCKCFGKMLCRDYFSHGKTIHCFNSFLVNVLILKSGNHCFCGVLKEYKMGALAKIGLKNCF